MAYGVITVASEEQAIEIARILTQAANAVHLNMGLSDIEQMCIATTLCFLRDSIQIKSGGVKMDKLTSRNAQGDLLLMGEQVYAGNVYEGISLLEDYEDTGLTPKEVAELAQAKREGRLIVLPCKIGDTIYRVINTKSCENCYRFDGTCLDNIVCPPPRVWEKQMTLSDVKYLDDIYQSKEAAQKAMEGTQDG